MDESGQPRSATALAASDAPAAWRDCRVDGGCVIDVAADMIVCNGLSMPHSPRLYRGQLYALESGAGTLVRIADGRAEPVAFLPGFARGLAMHEGHALITLSRPRTAEMFDGLPLAARLRAAGEPPRCAIVVVDLASGRILQELRFGDAVQELYDVATLPAARRPTLVTAGMPAIDRLISRGADLPLAELNSRATSPPGS